MQKQYGFLTACRKQAMRSSLGRALLKVIPLTSARDSGATAPISTLFICSNTCAFNLTVKPPLKSINRLPSVLWGNARGRHRNSAALLSCSTSGHNVSKSVGAFLVVGLGLLQRNEVKQLMELGHDTADVITGKAAVFHRHNHIAPAGTVTPRLR